AASAVEVCRERRCPVLLHLRCVRLMGHSGADPDTVYRSRSELDLALAADPVLASARLLLEHDVLSGQGLADLDARIAEQVWASAVRSIARPKLSSAAEIMEPITAGQPAAVREE